MQCQDSVWEAFIFKFFGLFAFEFVSKHALMQRRMERRMEHRVSVCVCHSTIPTAIILYDELNDDRRHRRCVTVVLHWMLLAKRARNVMKALTRRECDLSRQFGVVCVYSCIVCWCFLSLLFALLFVQTLFPSTHCCGINVVCQYDKRSLLQGCSFAQRHWKHVEHHRHTQAGNS